MTISSGMALAPVLICVLLQKYSRTSCGKLLHCVVNDSKRRREWWGRGLDNKVITIVISHGCPSNTVAPFYAIAHVSVEDRCTSQFTTLLFSEDFRLCEMDLQDHY